MLNKILVFAILLTVIMSGIDKEIYSVDAYRKMRRWHLMCVLIVFFIRFIISIIYMSLYFGDLAGYFTL